MTSPSLNDLLFRSLV
ncbi:hypothetical protein LINGRAHAP2_LOCUS34897 [Linum grandiflorum]